MDFHVGQFFEENFSFSKENISSYMKLTGDFNKIHFDEEYAASTIFKKPIAHGMLSAGVFSKIIGNDFPANNCVYISQNFNFIKPVYIDEEYVARVEIKDIIKEKLFLKTIAYKNTYDFLVIDGNAVVSIKKIEATL